MEEDFSAQSYTNSGLVYYNNIAVGSTSVSASSIYYNFANANPGIFIEWEHSGNTNTAFYRIQKSSFFEGTYTTLATVPYPMNEGVDTKIGRAHV